MLARKTLFPSGIKAHYKILCKVESYLIKIYNAKKNIYKSTRMFNVFMMGI
jgi:hypothetical protein